MFDIGKYLEKFKEISYSHGFLKTSVAEAIKEVCDININPTKIKIKNFTVRINEKPIIKTEIFLKKTKILNILDEKTNGKVKEIL